MYRPPFVSRRAFTRGILASVSALPLAGCLAGSSGGGLSGIGDGDDLPPTNAPPTVPGGAIGTGTVRIALILPLTGQGSVAAAALRNAAELALLEFQNPDIQLIVKDDLGTPQGARTAADAALAEGAELVLGPLFATSVQAAAQATRAANRPMIAFSTDSSVASRGVYLLSFLAENEVERVVSYAVSQNRRSFVAIVPESPYGRVVEAAFQQATASAGARVVGIARYPAGDRTAMAAAAQQVAGPAASADGIFMPDTADNLPALVGALQTANINLTRVKPLGTGIWNDVRVFRIPQLAGAWFAAPEAAGYDAFAGRYRARYNSDPTRIATLSYDAVSLAAALVRTAGPQRFSDTTLTNRSGFRGVDGVFRFLPNGTNERGLAVYQIGTGAAQPVSPAPQSLGGPGT